MYSFLVGLSFILKFVHIVVCVHISILFMAESYSLVGGDHSLFTFYVYSQLACSQFGAIKNKAAVNTHIQVVVRRYACGGESQGVQGLGRMLGGSRFVFQSGWTILHSHQ